MGITFLSRPAPVSMADSWFELATRDHFWIRWRFEALKCWRSSLPETTERILEVGCGSGIFREQLEEELHYTVDGCDLNLTALEQAKPGKGNLMVYDIYEQRPEMRAKYSGLFLMDVIEHIQEDLSFLKACAFHLKPGGKIIINVPNGPLFYGAYDRIAGHCRRYTKRELLALLEKASLTTEKIGYWGFSLIPILCMRNLRCKFTPDDAVIRNGFKVPSQLTHRALLALMKGEVGCNISPPYGTSLLAVARTSY